MYGSSLPLTKTADDQTAPLLMSVPTPPAGQVQVPHVQLIDFGHFWAPLA